MRLIIAEKPSVARELAKYVGADRKERGYLSGEGIIVSWCVGHLIEMAPPEAYDADLKTWSLRTLPIIPENYQTVVKEQTADQFKTLQRLLQREDLTDVVCATDAGREGELIFRLVYEKAGCNKPIKRLWISSLEEKSVREGLAALKDGDEFMQKIEGFIRDFIRDSKMLSSPEDCKNTFRTDREAIGVCPRCGKSVVEYPKCFACESGKDGCGFVIWKQVAGKAVTAAQAKRLLSTGKTTLIKGFKSKAGKPFDAMLALRADYSVGFEFSGK